MPENTEVPLEWPKDPMSKKVQRLHGRIEAILCNFRTATWSKAVSEASLRTNLRTALELQVQLEKNPHAVLIERNQAHVTALNTIQHFLKSMRTFLTSPTDDLLLQEAERLNSLHQLVCKSGRDWYVVLSKLRLHSTFLSKVRDEDIDAAVRFLDIDNVNCKARCIYQELLSAEPQTVPKDVMVWIETCVVEPTAKDVIRTLDIGVATRSPEYKRAARFFALYCESIKAVESFSAGLRQRASAAHVLLEAMVGESVSPADIDKALRALGNKKNDFCKSFEHYKAGQELVAHGRGLVQRNAEDIIADQCLHAAVAMLRHGDDEADTLTPVVAAELVGRAESIAAKLHEAMPAWSDMRLEEQLGELTSAIHGLAELPLKLCFALVGVMGEQLAGVCADALVATDGFLGGTSDEANYLTSLRTVRGRAIRVKKLVEEHSRECEKAATSIHELLAVQVPRYLACHVSGKFQTNGQTIQCALCGLHHGGRGRTSQMKHIVL